MLDIIALNFPLPISQVAKDIVDYKQKYQVDYDKFIHDRLYDLYEVSFRFVTSSLWAIWNVWGHTQDKYIEQTELLLQKLRRPTISTWVESIPQKLCQLLEYHPDQWVQQLREQWFTTRATHLRKGSGELWSLASIYLDNKNSQTGFFQFMSQYRNKLARGHGSCLAPAAYQSLANALEKELVRLLLPYQELFQHHDYNIVLINRIEQNKSNHYTITTKNRSEYNINEEIKPDHWYILKQTQINKQKPHIDEVIGNFGPLILPLGLHDGWMINDSPVNQSETLSEYLSYTSGFFRRHSRRGIYQRLGLAADVSPSEESLAFNPLPPPADKLFQNHPHELIPITLVHEETRQRIKAEQLVKVISEQSLILIEAPGGFGKTGLCRFLFKILENQKQQPIYVRLRDYHPQFNPLSRLLGHSVGYNGELTLDMLKQAPIVLLLDGLNELSYEDRRICSQEIALLLDEYPTIPTLVLGRNWKQELDDLARRLKQPYRLQIQPLSDEVIAHFLERHLPPTDWIRIKKVNFTSYLHTPFLLLTYLSLSDKPVSLQAGNLLYALAEQLLNREQTIQGWSDQKRNEIWALACYTGLFLQHLSKFRWSRAETNQEIPPSLRECHADWEDELVECGLWVRVLDNDTFEFAHHQLQELCAAEQMLNIWKTNSEMSFESLVLAPQKRLEKHKGPLYSSTLARLESLILSRKYIIREIHQRLKDDYSYEDVLRRLELYKSLIYSFILFVERAAYSGIYKESKILQYSLELIRLNNLPEYSGSPMLSQHSIEALAKAASLLPIPKGEARYQLTLWFQASLEPFRENILHLKDLISETAMLTWQESHPQDNLVDFEQPLDFIHYPNINNVFSILDYFPKDWLPDVYPILVSTWENYQLPIHIDSIGRDDIDYQYRSSLITHMVKLEPEKTWNMAISSLKEENGGHWAQFLRQFPNGLWPRAINTHGMLSTLIEKMSQIFLTHLLQEMPSIYQDTREILHRLHHDSISPSKVPNVFASIDTLRIETSNFYNPLYQAFLYFHHFIEATPLGVAACVQWLNEDSDSMIGDIQPWQSEWAHPTAIKLRELAEYDPPAWKKHSELLENWFCAHTYRTLMINDCFDVGENVVGAIGADWLAAQFSKAPPTQAQLTVLLENLPPDLHYIVFEWLISLLCPPISKELELNLRNIKYHHARSYEYKPYLPFDIGGPSAIGSYKWDEYKPIIQGIITEMMNLCHHPKFKVFCEAWFSNLCDLLVEHRHSDRFSQYISADILRERIDWVYNLLNPFTQSLMKTSYDEYLRYLDSLPKNTNN